MASSSTLSLLSLSSVLLVSSQYRDCAIVVVNMVARSGCDTSVVLDSVSYGRHMLVIISVVYQADICAVVELILSMWADDESVEQRCLLSSACLCAFEDEQATIYLYASHPTIKLLQESVACVVDKHS